MSYTPMELAEVFIKTGELNDALEALNQQLANAPQDAKARRLRASVLLRFDEPEQLKQALVDLQQIPDPAREDFVQQSVIYERLGKKDDAIQVMHTAHETLPEDERILERLVEVMTDAEHYNEVIALLKNAPQTWRWLMRQADTYTAINQPEDALIALNRAADHLVTIFPDLLSPVSRNSMARIHVARGQVYMKLNDLDAAESDFKDALYHIPDDVTITFNLGLIYALKENMSKAKRYCQKALNATSDYVRQTLIDVLDSDERYDELKANLTLD